MLTTVKILEAHGLRVFDVEELASHGGSLRVFACRAESKAHVTTPSVQRVIDDEEKAGLDSLEGYKQFGEQVKQTKLAFVDFLHPGSERGQDDCRLWSSGKERDATSVLRHREGLDRVHGG